MRSGMVVDERFAGGYGSNQKSAEFAARRGVVSALIGMAMTALGTPLGAPGSSMMRALVKNGNRKFVISGVC